jgi:hypothetical protein
MMQDLQAQELGHVDTVFEWVGYNIAGTFHDSLWTGIFIAVPAAIFAGSVIWTVCRCIRQGDYHDIPLYFAYSLAVTWLIWPVEHVVTRTFESDAAQVRLDTPDGRADSIRKISIKIPRALGWVSSLMDQLVGTARYTITANMPGYTKDFTYVATLVDHARIHDSATIHKLGTFFDSCYIAALQMRVDDPKIAAIPILDQGNILYDPGLRTIYAAIPGSAGVTCRDLAKDLDTSILKDELLVNPYHLHVLKRLDEWAKYYKGNKAGQAMGAALYEQYKARVIRNTLFVGVPGVNELAMASVNFKNQRTQLTGQDWMQGIGEIALTITGIGPASGGAPEEGRKKLVDAATEAITDFVANMGKKTSGYALVHHFVVYAPAFYGFVILIVLSFFPLVAIWTLLPFKLSLLVRYFKILVGVKLWPAFWAVITAFYDTGSLAQVLNENQTAPNALFIAVAMYLLVPVICVGIVELSASFGAMSMHSMSSLANHAASAAAGTVFGMVMATGAQALGAGARILGGVGGGRQVRSTLAPAAGGNNVAPPPRAQAQAPRPAPVSRAPAAQVSLANG